MLEENVTSVGNVHTAVFPRAPMPCAPAECAKRLSGAPLAGSTQLQGISAARGIPPKLHQSDNSDSSSSSRD
jgi:hypothetical protein